ncbi:hypothetical protein [Clostridium botulinum]|uniref:hypothetical protein n=1 Tax=Clostridium botulinum TaxID=1491 RepID=UPI000AD8A3FC|nr:hypothetical protein [Clostridium botulinum]
MKFDMLEIKKDRLKEIDKQLRIIYKTKKYVSYEALKAEKEILKEEIQLMEVKRGR